MNGWRPYRPPWYPGRGPNHNPWATDPNTMQQGHETFYTTWADSLTPSKLLATIEENR